MSADIYGTVTYVGKKSLKVEVKIFTEKMYSTDKELAVSGIFSMVAIDEEGKSTQIL